jgi:hypothetical protein
MRKIISTVLSAVISVFPSIKGGLMKKMVVTFSVMALISATASVPAFADGWGGHYHGRGGGFDPFWPITLPIAAALAIPAAIVGTVARAAVPVPLGYGYSAPPAPVYSGPATYYAPGQYVAPRVYAAPMGYYNVRAYGGYRRGW